MKVTFSALTACLFSLSLATLSTQAYAGPLKAMKSINCSYVDGTGKSKRPVVHIKNDTKVVHGQEDDFDAITKMTVSVATIVKGAKVNEYAEVTKWDTDGTDEAFDSTVTVVTNSKRLIEIKFKNYGGQSTMTVNREAQAHMKGLTCVLGLGA